MPKVDCREGDTVTENLMVNDLTDRHQDHDASACSFRPVAPPQRRKQDKRNCKVLRDSPRIERPLNHQAAGQGMRSGGKSFLVSSAQCRG